MTRASIRDPDEAEMDRAAPDPLMAIRNRIDAIDEAMHRLLIDRSSVIAELIRIKGTSKPGAAFRPDREADMMRRIAMRHAGDLPLATVEHIWREIITTFTAMQAPFGVTAGPARDPLAMRDLVRFYFGFSDPGRTGAHQRRRDLERCALTQGRCRHRGGGEGPMVATVLPAPTRRRSLPSCRSSKFPTAPPTLPPTSSARRSGRTSLPTSASSPSGTRRRLKKAAASLGGAVAARADDEALVELPVAAGIDELAAAAGLSPRAAREVGGFFQPIASWRSASRERRQIPMGDCPARNRVPASARHLGLCSGRRQSERGARLQALLERNAARPEPARGRGLSRQRRPAARLSGRLGAHPARSDRRRRSGSIRSASSAATAPTSC